MQVTDTGKFVLQPDGKSWKLGWLTIYDKGKVEGGVTHRYEVYSTDFLGWVLWRPGWRRYIYRSTGVSVELDFSCLTTIAEFCKMKTDERKLEWGKQGRFPDR